MAELALDRTSPPSAAGWARRKPQRTTMRSVPREPLRPMRRHRTIFISDVHLGTRGCKAELLADFLVRNSCETLFLVGDIVDGWRLKRRWYWPDAHNRVIEALLRKIDAGTRVIYVPGNHDEVLRSYCGRSIAGVEVMYEAIHETADGRQLLVLHGDRFDAVIAYAKWLAHLGDGAYTMALHLNEVCHVLRRALNLPYWSLSAWLKGTRVTVLGVLENPSHIISVSVGGRQITMPEHWFREGARPASLKETLASMVLASISEPEKPEQSEGDALMAFFKG